MAGHTPGPWTMRDRRTTAITSALEDKVSKVDLPFTVSVPHGPFAFGAVGALVVTEANARLIAAAPDLLAALEAVVARCEALEEFEVLGSDVRSAIAKAKGREEN